MPLRISLYPVNRYIILPHIDHPCLAPIYIYIYVPSTCLVYIAQDSAQYTSEFILLPGTSSNAWGQDAVF